MASPWSCPVCTFRNDGSCSFCNVCEQPKIELDRVSHLLGPGRSQAGSGAQSAHSTASSGAWGFGLAGTQATSPTDELDFRNGGDDGAVGGSEGGAGRRRRSLVAELSDYVSDSTVPSLLNDALAGFVTASFGFAGATVGAVAGALAGRATSSGVIRGAGLGALAGAIVCVEALEASRSYLSSLRAVYPARSEDAVLGSAGRLVFDTDQDHIGLLSGPSVGGMAGLFIPHIELRPGSPEEEFFRDLPAYAVDAAGAAQAEKCSICLETPREYDVMRSLPRCQHAFHRACIDRWLCRRNFTCPVCRQLVFS